MSSIAPTAPGAPQNLKVNNQTEHWVSLSWDNPLERPSCVDRQVVDFSYKLIILVTSGIPLQLSPQNLQ